MPEKNDSYIKRDNILTDCQSGYRWLLYKVNGIIDLFLFLNQVNSCGK